MNKCYFETGVKPYVNKSLGRDTNIYFEADAPKNAILMFLCDDKTLQSLNIRGLLLLRFPMFNIVVENPHF
jgi:hypothetical protein